jgi:hypothetical protein
MPERPPVDTNASHHREVREGPHLRARSRSDRPASGFVVQQKRTPDADVIGLYGFRVRGPHEPDPAEREAELRRAVESMNPPRFYTLSLDGSLIERDGL